MLVPGIGELDRQRADIRSVQFRKDRRHRNIVDVRAVIVAPADVQPDAVAGNALDAKVDGGDMQFQLPQDRFRLPDKNPRVPIEVPCLQKVLCHTGRRFFASLR